MPSRYAVCVYTDASDRLSTLSAAARDLLAGAGQLHLEALVGIDPAGFAWWEGSTEYCYDIATDEARTLATTLEEAGIEESPHRWYDGSEVFYDVPKPPGEDSSDAEVTWITLAVWPMLPHGVPGFTGA